MTKVLVFGGDICIRMTKSIFKFSYRRNNQQVSPRLEHGASIHGNKLKQEAHKHYHSPVNICNKIHFGDY